MDSKTKCPKCEKNEIFLHELSDSNITYYCQNQKCKYIWRNYKSTSDSRDFKIHPAF